MGSAIQNKDLGFRVFTLLRDQYWSRGEPVPVPGPVVGATVPMAVGRRANDLGRLAPSKSKGLSAAPPL